MLDRRLEDLEISAGVAALLSSTALPLSSLGLFSDGGDGWVHFFAKSVLKTATPEQVSAQLRKESCSSFQMANPMLSKTSGGKIRGSEVYGLGFQMVVLAVGDQSESVCGRDGMEGALQEALIRLEFKRFLFSFLLFYFLLSLP